MSTTALLTTAAILALLHPLLMRGLLIVVEPMRLRMADVSAELLASGELNNEQKDQAESMVESAFDWRFMIMAAFCAPVLVVMKIFGKSFNTPLDKVRNASVRAKFDSLIGMHIASVAAANPLFAMVLGVEFILLLPLLIAQRLVGRAFTVKESAQRILVVLETHHNRQISHAH